MEGRVITGIPVVKQWKVFERRAESLQNIHDVEGNDLLPLPNTKRLPYLDILLEDSKITPRILIYSGKLSERQKELFENLYEESEKRVFPVNFGDLNLPVEKLVSTPYDMDDQRLTFLKHRDKLISHMEEKFNVSFKIDGIMYNDFDNVDRIKD